MLDKRQICLMTKAAIYEKTKEKKDMAVSGYFRKDYAGFSTLKTLLWITIGYGALVGGWLFLFAEPLMEDVSVASIVTLSAFILGVYLCLLVIYGIFAYTFYLGRHDRARHRVRSYYKCLMKIEKMTARGNKEQ